MRLKCRHCGNEAAVVLVATEHAGIVHPWRNPEPLCICAVDILFALAEMFG